MRNVFNLTFRAQPNADLERLIRENGSVHTVPARETILEAENPAKGVYYILNGRTRHYLLGADGSEKILFVLTAGWFFGEVSCQLSRHQDLYVTAEEKTEVCFIPIEWHQALLEDNRLYDGAIRQSMAQKALILCNEIESLTFLTSKDRLLQLFYSSADTAFAFDGKWYPLKYNYTQQELGIILGVSRVTISKFVNEFCNDGVIRIVNRRMQINIGCYNRLDNMMASPSLQ